MAISSNDPTHVVLVLTGSSERQIAVRILPEALRPSRRAAAICGLRLVARDV
jgi:hypothetical protein